MKCYDVKESETYKSGDIGFSLTSIYIIGRYGRICCSLGERIYYADKKIPIMYC